MHSHFCHVLLQFLLPQLPFDSFFKKLKIPFFFYFCPRTDLPCRRQRSQALRCALQPDVGVPREGKGGRLEIFDKNDFQFVVRVFQHTHIHTHTHTHALLVS